MKHSKLFGLLEEVKNLLNSQLSSAIDNIRYCKIEEGGEHLPSFDDSGWTHLQADQKLSYDQDDELLWVRFKITIPKEVCGIKLLGKRARLRSMFQAPVDFYIDGELRMREAYWIDFQSPEMVLSEKSLAGESFNCAMRIASKEANWGGSFNCWPEFDSTDLLLNDIECFMAEMTYLSMGLDEKELARKISDNLVLHVEEILASENFSNLSLLFLQVREKYEYLRTRAKDFTVHLITHAHIDMNWLWTTEETHNLVRRDFSALTELLEEYPQMRFSQSQCATYEMIEKDDPEVFEKIKTLAAEGRWDITASSWVENDMNMPSGESIARQILYSGLYLHDKFDFFPKIMWAPDTFGHSGNIPQLLRKSGIDEYFHTRCFPFEDNQDYESVAHTHVSRQTPYIWEGIDGSRLLTASMVYGGNLSLISLVDYALIARKKKLKDALYVFGVGNHGGGPTRRDIEFVLFAAQSPLLPKLIFNTSSAYFSGLKDTIKKKPVDMYVHKGDLNFIFEACYSTHGKIKKYLRSLESKLFTAEFLAALAHLKALKDDNNSVDTKKDRYKYPGDELQKIWKTLLFNQFHDILCGCSTGAAYDEAYSDLQDAEDKLSHLTGLAEKSLMDKKEDELTVLNMAPYSRNALIEMPGHRTMIRLDDLAPFSRFDLNNKKVKEAKTATDDTFLPALVTDEYIKIDGPYYYIWLERASGQITTYYDKITKRFLANTSVRIGRMDRGLFNVFSVSKEICDIRMTAWVFDKNSSVEYLHKDAVCNLVEDGQMRKVIRLEHLYGASTISQEIVFEINSPMIKFHTKVDWKEKGTRKTHTPALRVGFMPDLKFAKLINEIPFGSMERDKSGAHYPQLRFSLLEDEAGGLALINDSKYGIYSSGNEMLLPLVRSSWEPDLHADIGQHEFSYMIGSFAGEASESDVLAHAFTFHSPLRVIEGRLPTDLLPDIKLGKNLAVSSIKKHEYSDRLLYRVYEVFGEQGRMEIVSMHGEKQLVETDIHERQELASYPLLDGRAVLDFKPYEIKTFYLTS